jgi:hypothetical protein
LQGQQRLRYMRLRLRRCQASRPQQLLTIAAGDAGKPLAPAQHVLQEGWLPRPLLLLLLQLVPLLLQLLLLM